ncbi:hypothetical protein AVEN_164844-1 [Araneus ventricosus]|uniref:ShKT domain-containing protein n=1 Tax=Araneus ventricosus TaxID=182803 RepID=A0A4Y2IQY5_ARAVE|nr:hypothetical protein AVEN_164844-1 [Araneus ventricosus]
MDGFTETHSSHMTPHSHYSLDKSTLETLDVKSILIDPLEEDDHEDFELYDIIVQSENIDYYDIDIYTDEQRQTFVDMHNLYRANFTYPIPEGSNMKMIEYNKTLEWAASEYIKLCKYEHGFADSDNMTYGTGQNLYKGSSPLISRHLWMFYYELPDWNFENQTCREDPGGKHVECGHFTQMMWAHTQHIGCARRSHCWPRETYIYVNCHYHPGGNWKRSYYIDMFRYGKPCTGSEMADGNLCHKNLTVDKRMCQDYNLDCECVLNCKNCATPNYEKCRCDCKEGWDSTDCGQPCEDTYHWVYPKFPKVCEESLKHPDWYPNLGCNHTLFLLLKCRKTCGFCTPLNQSATADRHCCGGKRCDWYSVLNTKTCECEKDCPTFGCLYEKAKSLPLRRTWPYLSTCSRFKPMPFLLLSVLVMIVIWVEI